MDQAAIARTKNTVRTVEDRLNKGWDWLNANPDHAEFANHETRWIDLLHDYEHAMDALREGTTGARQ